jgi:16S rRNA (guanine527-N7)-methyltransferase
MSAAVHHANPAPERRASDTPAGTRQRIDTYLDLLEKWNRVYNLTAVRARAEMETLHVQDALAVLPWLPADAGLRVLDVGSGAGIPGIPLALARPDAHFVLLDANSKKTAFLAQAIIELGLRNVRVATARVEAFRPAEPFDVVVSRAFSDLATFVRVAAPQIAPGGLIVAMKGVLPHDEIAALPAQFHVVGTPSLAIPGLAAARHLVIMQKQEMRS